MAKSTTFPKLYAISTQGVIRDSKAMTVRLLNIVEKSMKHSGSVSSASGRTAAMAINYCERRGLNYTVNCVSGMYYVAIGRKDP